MFLPLQVNPTPEAQRLAEKFSPDSLSAKGEQMAEIIMHTPPKELITDLLRSCLQFGLKVLAALVIYLVGGWCIRKIKALILKRMRHRKAEPTLISFVLSLTTAVLWIILIILMIGTLGLNTTSLAALLAAGGMAIGMALSGTVQNFAGGIMILTFKPFKAGDFIEAQGYSGTVKEVNLVSTKLLTIDNREIILPNGALANGNINNYNKNEIRRLDLTIGLSYGADAEGVRAALLEIIARQPLFLDSTTPGAADPFVGVSALNDSSVDFVVRVWIKSSDYWQGRFWLLETAYTELPKRGYAFPFPQMDVHMKQD